MQHRLDGLLREEPPDERAVADIAFDDPGRGRGKAAPAGREIVEHDDPPTGVDKRPGDMAADVTGSAGHQRGQLRHEKASPLGF